jgi:Leucine-rich repeat (LRR) protein
MLTGNMLSSLPDEMSNCTEIELLRLSANDFTSIPSWIFRLPKLSWLAFSGNPGVNLSFPSENCDYDPTASTNNLRDIDWSEIRLGRLLGEGASGRVFEGYWLRTSSEMSGLGGGGHSSRATDLLEEKLAIKIFKGDITSDGMPSDEVIILNRIGCHKSMISLVGNLVNGPEGKVGVALSFVDSAYTVLAKPPSFQSVTRDVYFAGETFDFKKVLRALFDLASVMKHLHERSISHGDLYGHNILIDRQTGSCLISDFGAATSYRSINLADDRSRSGGISISDEFEKIEVRAFGVLCEELLERLDGSRVEFEEERKRLTALSLLMLSDDCGARPSFSAILAALESIVGSIAM